MSHPFDKTFPNPFPSLPVVLYQVDGSALTSSLPALVDTGADTTLIPEAYLQPIQNHDIEIGRLRSHWGEWRLASIYTVDLEVAGERLPGIKVVADDQDEQILLGRNVTNKLIFLLDGPRQQSDVLTRRPRRLSIAGKES